MFISYLSNVLNTIQIISTILLILITFVVGMDFIMNECGNNWSPFKNFKYKKELMLIWVISLILTIFTPVNIEKTYMTELMNENVKLKREKVSLEFKLKECKYDCRLIGLRSENY